MNWAYKTVMIDNILVWLNGVRKRSRHFTKGFGGQMTDSADASNYISRSHQNLLAMEFDAVVIVVSDHERCEVFSKGSALVKIFDGVTKT
jgi:hypothetical protein